MPSTFSGWEWPPHVPPRLGGGSVLHPGTWLLAGGGTPPPHIAASGHREGGAPKIAFHSVLPKETLMAFEVLHPKGARWGPAVHRGVKGVSAFEYKINSIGAVSAVGISKVSRVWILFPH